MSVMIQLPLFRHYATMAEAIAAHTFVNDTAWREMPDMYGVFYIDNINPECGCGEDQPPLALALFHVAHHTHPADTPEDLAYEARVQELRELAERRWIER